MFKFRQLLALGIAAVMLMAVMIPWASARPAQQDTPTPEATIAATEVMTSEAPAVSPLATPESTPSTLPTTGGNNDMGAALGLILLALGALVLFGAFGLAMSHRSHITR